MIRRLLLALGALVAVWLVLSAVLFVWPRTGALPAHADAVVVLSGGLNSRLDPGVALVRRGLAPVLVISSAFHDRKWVKAHRLCRARGLRFRVVCFEASPYSTQGEAQAVARLARARGWRRVVVVTSSYHVTRARMLFRRCYRGGLWFDGTPSPWWRLPEEWAFETGKLAVQLTVRRHC